MKDGIKKNIINKKYKIKLYIYIIVGFRFILLLKNVNLIL